MKRGLLFALSAGVLLLVVLMAGRTPSRRPTSAQVVRPAALPISAIANAPGAVVTHAVSTNVVSPGPVATSLPEKQTSDFTAFAGWVERRLGGDPSADAARGEALAWKRREAMLELIERDPAQALALAVPFSWHKALPANVTRHFEQWIDGRGAFEVAMAESITSGEEIVYRWAVIDGKRYQAFVHGRRLAQKSQQNVPLHGIALAGKIALTPGAIRFVEADEARALEHARGHAAGKVCAVCGQSLPAGGQGTIGEIGGETRLFCSEDHAQLVNQNLSLAAKGGADPAPNAVAGGGTSWTLGRKDVLYMRVNFPDDLTEPNSETAAYSAMNAVNQFYVDNTYDQLWLSTTVTPLLTLPQVKAWYGTAGPASLLADAREAARKAGFDTANYQLDIVSHTTVPNFDWCGLGYVGGKGTWLQCSGAGVTAHELGHNFGVVHANLWNPDADYTSIHGTGTNLEYGNIFDTMGNAAAGNNQFNALFKNNLDWLPAPVIHTVISNGVYRLHALDASLRTSGRFYAATVRKDFERDYWLEFRNRFTGNVSLQNGILLDWSPWSQSGGVELLDATPATATLNDAAVVIGRTFSDSLAGIHITPLARGATGTDPWIDVRINLDTSAPNMPCCLKVEVEPANATPGQLVRFHATVADRDDNSFAYAWSFDDGTFSTNNQPWAYKSWTTTGEHVVRCEVSDMRGGRASANVIATVGGASDFRVSGLVLDENGHALEDVFIKSTFTNASDQPVTGFTDSDGVFVLTGVTGQFDIAAAKYGYTFDSVGWANPLNVTSNFAHADFRARQMTNVTLTLSTNLVIENIASTNQFTLTRRGTNDDLTVELYLSGSANVPGDLVITPPLVPGTNSVVIPAGTNQLVFTFTPVNDGTIEATEVAYVTIRDSAGYVVTPLAEGRISILDDDQLVVPEVAVVALDGPVLENGMNNAGFRFTRAGSTAGALPVNYSIGGSATAGTDYATLLGTVIIPAGSASAVVELQVRDDKDVEPNETVSVTISSSPTYTIDVASATETILDDDVLVVTVTPTQSGLAEPSATGRFTVKRDGDQTANLVVNYTLTGSASNGVDYVSPSGTVTIPAGAASAEVVITAMNDAFVEGDESVTLVLLTNAACDIGTPGSATLTLRDDEKVTVTVTAPDDAASEPGSDFGEFTLSRGAATSGNLTVNLAINGTALAGSDYLPLDNPAVIPDGSSSVTLTVIPFDDLHWEETIETVIVTLVASTNYNLGTPRQATVNIADDETSGSPAVGFCFSTCAALESESPGLAVALSRTSSVPVTVQYQVIGGTAASGADYTLTPGTLTFDPGEWAKSIPLTISDDTDVEADETIKVTLFNPVGATHDGIKVITYTIKDDDLSSVSVGATVPTADEVGPVAGNFRITRTGSTNASLLVNFQITGTASAPSDFPALGTSVTLPAGIEFVDLPVIPVDDATVEMDEEVTLTLISAPGGKIVAPGADMITILDANTNGLPVVTLTSTNQPSAVEGGTNGAFVLTRTGPTNSALTVFLTTAGVAASGTDYTALPASVVIPAGQFSVTLPVTPVNDSLIEGEETVLASVTARDTYRAAFPGTAQVVVQDNDQSVRIDASDFEAAEPGTNSGEFTFTRFGTTNTAVQIFFTISGSASNGVDYVAISNSIVIPAGSLTATRSITPLDDALIEGAEVATLTLQANVAYTLGASTAATAKILDDEPMVSIVASRDEIFEGSQTPVVLTVKRGGNTAYEFTARLAVGGAAGYGVDYPAFATNVFFNCGVAAIDLLIFPTNELATEVSETISVTVLPDAAYSRLAPSNAVVTITDAGTNLAPLVTITSPTTNRVYLLPLTVNMILEATVADDGDTNLPPVTLTWTNMSGPGTLVFGTPNDTNTTVSFVEGGEYVLRLTADDGQVAGYDEVTVVVGAFARFTNNPANSELLYWTFDEGSGTNVLDASGQVHHGAIQGAAGWVTNGMMGGALNLSGTNNFVRAVGDSGFLNGRASFTLVSWVKAADSPATRGLFTADDSGLVPTMTLATRTTASCGSSSNVIEGTLATSCEDARQVSAANVLTNGWQHIAVTWSNGLAPSLYINGELDRPGKHQVSLDGVLANCPQFLLGKGPVDITNTWAGLVDEVRVFPWAMDAAEIGAFVAANFGAIVEVPTNITVQILTPVDLTGVVTDDGRPIPPGTVTLTWSQVSGPPPVPIPDPSALTNTVSFTNAGDYVFRLVADDGQVKIYEDLPVTVVEPTQVSAFASDGDAAELGPDTGEIMITRVGDLSVELTVYFTMSGTASNGADFVLIPQTNSVTFAVDSNSIVIPVIPFLDHRTEGDETITLTVQSNLIYTISSGVATVTIHDSPYGQWNIANFTLEQLTDPTLSGEVADFDHDGLVNFAEYAANRDPKGAETNSPLQTTIELNPGDGLDHITLTYQRRIPPTDVAYAIGISTNLLNWQTDTNLVEEISVTPDGNSVTETVNARLVAPWPQSVPQFITIRVWLLSTGP